MKNKFKRSLSMLLAVLIFSSTIMPTFAAEKGIIPQSTATSISVEQDSAPNKSTPTSDNSLLENSSVPSSSSEPVSSSNTSTSTDESGTSSLPNSKASSISAEDNSTTSEISVEEMKHPIFVPLAITEMTTTFATEIGSAVDFFVKLNREDVAVAYQWQRLYTEPEVAFDAEPMYNYGERESTDYAWLIEDKTPAQWLNMVNPDARWPGCEMYFAKAAEQAKKQRSALTASETTTWPEIEIANGTKNEVLNTESVGLEAQSASLVAADDAVWQDISGANASVYRHEVNAEDADAFYRCSITINDEKYLKAAQETAAPKEQASSDAAENEDLQQAVAFSLSEEAPVTAEIQPIPESGILADKSVSEPTSEAIIVEKTETAKSVVTQFLSNSMYVELLPKVEPQANSRARTAEQPIPSAYISLDNQWITGLDYTMEYITAAGFGNHGGSSANNLYWTKLSGGTRAGGTKYAATTLTESSKMEVLSAWYGKTIYVRYQGSNGRGKEIRVPAFTARHYQTGKFTLYKSAVKIFNAWVSDTGRSFYASYMKTISDANGYPQNGQGTHITVDKEKIDLFNKVPISYLTDAEGNYKYDLVIVGACTDSEPDISGAAAWALKDYINEGYGFMIGHDTMYGYGGVTNEDYVPDKNSTITPYYKNGTLTDGHFNMAWLMGVNKKYTEASPYEAASMILNIGNYTDKSVLYGDSEGSSTLRIKKAVSGDPITEVSVRCPTNYPYAARFDGLPFNLGNYFDASATHTNEQLAYGTVWIDYASNTLEDIGLGHLVEDNSNGLYGSNNFYLTTGNSQNFGMSQIGHVKDNLNFVKTDEVYILANTVMYLSQRQQCQVCQSEQGQPDARSSVHFVRKINSAEELAHIGKKETWFNYPIGDCYMLANDITLPEDWQPIANFSGHFNADGHSITVPSGKTVFEPSGTDWRLGTDKTKGVNKIYAEVGQRTTSIARVSGYLQELFGTGNTIDWAEKIVVADGTDGVQYASKTNTDGKYIFSNLPCTGVMNVHVYNTNIYAQASAANEVTQYGVVRVNVPAKFWESSETIPLYLVGFKAKPVSNTSIYEGQTAALVNGGVFYPTKISNINWQYLEKGGTVWKNLADTNIFDYTVTAPVFHADGDASWTETSLSIKNCLENKTGYSFRAVFTSEQGKAVDTYSVREAGKAGQITVLPRPIYLTQAQNKIAYADETVSFTSTAEYWKTVKDGMEIRWQYKIDGADWADIEGSGLFSNFNVNNSATANTGINDASLAPHTNTSTLTLNYCDLGWNNYKFQVVYSFDCGSGRKYWMSSSADKSGYEGKLNMRPSSITATQPQNQKVIVNYPVLISSDIVTYKSTITYCPGKVNGASTPAVPNIKWQYKNRMAFAKQLTPQRGVKATQRFRTRGFGMEANADKLPGMAYKDWNQSVASALYPSSGISVSITNGAPVATGKPNEYKIETTMTVRNLPVEMDKGDTHFFFVAKAETTHLSKNIVVRSENADLSIDYSIDIKHKTPVEVCNPNQSTTVQYPSLEIYAPQGLRTVKVQFSNPNRDARDGIAYPPLPWGITAEGSQYSITFTSAVLLPSAVWESFLRGFQFIVFDSETELYWRIDENATNLSYSSENGHFYEYVPSDGITWTDAYSAARGRYNSDLDTYGYLATVTDAAEQGVVKGVNKGTAWLGGTNVNTGGAYMYWQEYSGNTLLSYTNWAVGEPIPMTGNEYMAMKANGTWEASTNTKSVSVTVTDKISWGYGSPRFPPFEMADWVVDKWGYVDGVHPEAVDNNQGYTGYRLEASNSALPNNSDTIIRHDVYLEQGHTYWMSAYVSDYGDSNGNIHLSTPFGDAWHYWEDDNGEFRALRAWTGASGTYSITAETLGSGRNYTGVGAQLYYCDLIDLTADFTNKGAELPSYDWCEQNLVAKTGSQTFNFTSAVSDKAGYLVEYGTFGNSFKRNNHNAYDIATVGGCGGVTPSKKSVKVNISAQSKVYDGTETNAVVSVTDVNGEALSAADRNKLLAGLNVSYNPTGKVTGANVAGSGAIHARNYVATVALAPGNASLLSEFNIEFVGEGRCTFTIRARAVHLISNSNNKVYDGNDKASIPNGKIVIQAKSADTGVIVGDTVAVASGTYLGAYADKHQTKDMEIPITRSPTTPISLINNASNDYYIASESYTGKITVRPLTVHSKYLDALDTTNNPRNTKIYDGTKDAVIKNILIDNIVVGDNVALNAESYQGNYATKDSGETLTSDGKVLPGRLKKLTENNITRTAPISLINNEHGDYSIIAESYSGAIYRNNLTVKVSDLQYIYGDTADKMPTTASVYSFTESGNGTHLNISQFVSGDSLRIDKAKSNFVFDEEITSETPVGLYGMRYEGLTETNYPVLRNYILWTMQGNVAVTPRTLRISMNGGYDKKYGSTNPAFSVKYEYLVPNANADEQDTYVEGFAVAGETPESVFDGALRYINYCTWQSEVLWADDNRTHLPYPVYVTGYTPKKNVNGQYNYELEWVGGSVTVHPVEITIYPIDKMKEYGKNEPYYNYNLSRPRVKESDLPGHVRRIQGEHVGLYKLLIDQFYDPNYIISAGPDAHLEITPAQLWVNTRSEVKFYGDENPTFYAYYTGFKHGDDEQNAIEGHVVPTTIAEKLSDVGEYPITPKGMRIAENINGLYDYILIENSGIFRIKKRPIDVYSDNVTKRTGEADPPLTWHLGEGQSIVDEDYWPLTTDLTRTLGEEENGVYPIYASKKEIEQGDDVSCAHSLQWDNPNYKITYHPGNLNIRSWDTLEAKVMPNEKIYGEANPTKYDIAYKLNGKAVTDIASLGITGTPVFTTASTTKSYVGEYDVSVSGISSTKYPTELTFATGKLTIKPRPATILSDKFYKVYGAPDPELTYKILDNLTGITYDGKDPAARINPGDLSEGIAYIDEFGDLGGKEANTYYTVLGGLANDLNYTLTIVPDEFRVQNTTLYITMEKVYRKYVGEVNPEFGVVYAGFVNGDTPENTLVAPPTYKTDCTKDSPADSYIVMVNAKVKRNKYGIVNYNCIRSGTMLYVTERPTK